jgi:hypothetical protein
VPQTGPGLPHYYYIFFELIVLVLLVGAGWLCKAYVHRVFEAGRRALLTVARRKLLAVVVCALLPVVLRLALLPWIEVPKPAIMEEFSYLLEADTFASGRLANPSHPMAHHFETFQVLQHPTYSSIRPPSQGLFLAAGQALTALPWAGVVLSVALLCASICWMLQGWFPPRWAFLGGLLAGIRLGVFSYWMNSYWGGAVAGLGACLVLGAAPRIRRSPQLGDACLMGLGIFLLFTSRGYEGLFVLLPVGIVMAAWLMSDRRIKPSAWWLKFALPLLLVVAGSGVWIGYYNYRVTGSPAVSPNVLGRFQRNIVPPFLWQRPGPAPVYQNAVFEEFYTKWELASYARVKQHYLKMMRSRAYDFWRVYVRPAFTLPLLALLWVSRDRRMRLFLAIAVIAILGQAVQTWFPTYYAAPLVGVVFAFVIQCLRHMRLWVWRGHRVGETLTVAICGTCVIVFVSVAATFIAGQNILENETSWASTSSRLRDRSFVRACLEKQPGKQLVIVPYLPGHNVHYEWVFNRADINGAKVVWARDLGAAENKELLAYFHERKAWLVEPDKRPVKVVPYVN